MRQIELLRFVLDILERLQIDYAVVGSYASGAWGEPRMTRDIDIVVRLTPQQVDPICAAFPEADFYVSRAAAMDAAKRHSQFNVIHPQSGNKIDFMIAKPGNWADSQLQRRRRIAFEPTTQGYVAAPEDVILGKLIYFKEGGAEKHLRDIAGILMTSQVAVDRAYIEKFAVDLGVGDSWQQVLKAVE